MSVGSGNYDIALIGFVIVLSSLLFLGNLTDQIQKINQTREYRLVAEFPNRTLEDYEAFFKQYNLVPTRGQRQRIGTKITGRWRVRGRATNHEKCIKHLLNDPDIKEFTF